MLAVIKLFCLITADSIFGGFGWEVLWVKAQNRVETISLSDSILGDNPQSSAEQRKQQ